MISADQRWRCALLHHSGLDKLEIAALTGLYDRKRVAQLVEEAESWGWIRYVARPPRNKSLSMRLVSEFQLDGACVVADPPDRRDGGRNDDGTATGPPSPRDLDRVLGGAGSEYFLERLSRCEKLLRGETTVLGVSGGRTMYHLVESVPHDGPVRPAHLRVEIRAISRHPFPELDDPADDPLHLSGGELAGMLARHFGAAECTNEFRFIDSPRDDGALDRARESIFSGRGRTYRDLDVAITGVGGRSGLAFQRIQSLHPELEILGEMLGQGLDPIPDDDPPSGLSFEELRDLLAGKNRPDVIAVAGGEQKVAAVLSVLGVRGDGDRCSPLVNHLVTTEKTALAVLAAAEVAPRTEEQDISRDDRRRWHAGCRAFLETPESVKPPHPTREAIRRSLVSEGLADTGSESAQRAEVTRLVNAAMGRNGGVKPFVEVRCEAPRAIELEARLIDLLRLEVRVAESRDAVPELAGRYVLHDLMRRARELGSLDETEEPPSIRIGISGGARVAATVRALAGYDFVASGQPRVDIHPLLGAPLQNPSATMLADSLVGRLRGARSLALIDHLPRDVKRRTELLEIPLMQQLNDEVRSLDIALLGFCGVEGPIAPPAEAIGTIAGRAVSHDASAILDDRPELGLALEHLAGMFREAEVERWRRARHPGVSQEQVRNRHSLIAVTDGESDLRIAEAVLRRNRRYAVGAYREMQLERLPDMPVAGAPWINVLITDAQFAAQLVDRVDTGF